MKGRRRLRRRKSAGHPRVRCAHWAHNFGIRQLALGESRLLPANLEFVMKNILSMTWAVYFWAMSGCSSGSAFSSGNTNSNSTGGQNSATGGSSSTGGDQGQGGDQGTAGTSTVSSGGYAGLTCDQLVAAYAAELVTAKQCSQDSTVAQCTGLVNGVIPCGCHTHVNSGRTGAIANMTKILDAYSANGCPACASPVTCGPTSSNGTCSSSGSGSTNRCVDN